MKKEHSDDQFFLGVEKKLSKLRVAEPLDCICLWSDLLGFGNPFFKNNWMLTPQDWISVQKRLFIAQSIAIRHYTVNNKLLILNDGIASTSVIVHDVDKPQRFVNIYSEEGEVIDQIASANALLQLSLFINSAVQIHQRINMAEREVGLPGTRTVLAFGQCAPYIPPRIIKDDFRLSSFEKRANHGVENNREDETILYNPYSFQMNTAFSKAYIIESIGSKGGITGANLYLDDSVIGCIERYAKDLNYMVIKEDKEEYVEILVPRDTGDLTDVVLGFRLSKPFKPEELRYHTCVYRVLRFYPHDELTNEFWYDLDVPCGYGPVA